MYILAAKALSLSLSLRGRLVQLQLLQDAKSAAEDRTSLFEAANSVVPFRLQPKPKASHRLPKTEEPLLTISASLNFLIKHSAPLSCRSPLTDRETLDSSKVRQF